MMGESLSQTVQIINPLGLHARAAGKLVNLVAKFNALVEIEKNGKGVGADSVMDLMMLTAGLGEEITVQATGPQAQEAIQAIISLINEGFGEI